MGVKIWEAKPAIEPAAEPTPVTEPAAEPVIQSVIESVIGFIIKSATSINEAWTVYKNHKWDNWASTAEEKKKKKKYEQELKWQTFRSARWEFLYERILQILVWS